MSVLGELIGVSPAKLAAVLAAPEWIADFLAREYEEAENQLSLFKKWHALHHLIQPLGPPVSDAVLGYLPIGTVDVRSYGPARYVPQDDAAEIAAALARQQADGLRAHFSVAAFKRADIYPFAWAKEENEESEWRELRKDYGYLVSFYAAVAERGEVVISYLH